jgi:hypothetical protein
VILAEDERGEMLAHDLSPEAVAHRVHAVASPLLSLRLRGQRVLKPTTLPHRVAALYLALVGEWGLRPLAGIATTPGLRDDGAITRATDTTRKRASIAIACRASRCPSARREATRKPRYSNCVGCCGRSPSPTRGLMATASLRSPHRRGTMRPPPRGCAH